MPGPDLRLLQRYANVLQYLQTDSILLARSYGGILQSYGPFQKDGAGQRSLNLTVDGYNELEVLNEMELQ